MRIKVLLPQWGMGMSEGTVVAWKKQVGDAVAEGEIIAEIETEKVTQELEAPATGVLAEILVPENTEAKVRTALAVIDTKG